nr:MAG TPA: hypothetical protein [Caudoviricetes sp.]
MLSLLSTYFLLATSLSVSGSLDLSALKNSALPYSSVVYGVFLYDTGFGTVYIECPKALIQPIETQFEVCFL